MVSNTSPCPPSLICIPNHVSLPTAPTYEFGSISISYAPEVTTGLGLFFWPQYHKHPDSPLSSPPPSPPETTAPLPEQESDLTTPYWVNNNNDEENLPPKFRSSERETFKSSAHASSLLSALELDLLTLPASPSGTPESTPSLLLDTTFTGVNDVPLPKTPVIPGLSPSPPPSPFSLPRRLESPPTEPQPLSPLAGFAILETSSSPEVHRRSTSEIERQSSITESPPESESPFIRLHPTDEKINQRYYMQRTQFTQQQPIDLPSLSLQPQSGHSQSASEIESVVDSSSAVQHNYTTELKRDDRDPIVHPSRLRKLSEPSGSGRLTQHAPEFRKSAKRPSESLPEEDSPSKRACVHPLRN